MSNIIKEITEIIDQGGPYYASQGLDTFGLGVYQDDKGLFKNYDNWEAAENECEQLNSNYVAKAILKCLQQAPVDFKSVYDKQIWIETIEGMISK